MDYTAKKDYVDEFDALLEDPAMELDEDLPEVPPAFDVLVALTNDEFARSVTGVVRALKQRRGASPSVLYVIEIGASIPEATMVAIALEEELRDPRTRARQEAEMKSVLHLDTGDEATWPFSIEVGGVAAVVVENAKRMGAELIVMGLHRHAAVGRAIGRDTVYEVMALGGIPVLAVREPLTALPRSVVVAVDFSRASIRAARLARRLVDDGGVMHLLFIEPAMLNAASESDEGLRLIQTKGVEAMFNELVSDLQPDSSVTINTVVRTGGNPAAEIMRFCETVNADLVAIGSQRHRFLERLLLGSTARSVAADGRWPLLVTPPAKAAAH